MVTQGQEQAFPFFEWNVAGYGDCVTLEIGGQTQHIPFSRGISTRLYVAAIAMQGMLANPNPDVVRMAEESIAKLSLIYADELLKQESE